MELTRSTVETLITTTDTFLFDCDGVLWNGPHLIDGAVELLNLLNFYGKRIIIISNNSSKSGREYLERFDRMGVDIKQENIVCTSVVLADYIKRNLNMSGKVYIVGMKGIAEELGNQNIPFYFPEPVAVSGDNLQKKRSEIEFKDDVGCVVVGISLGFDYQQLSEAGHYLENKECHFLAANDDISYPVRPGLHLPGAGVILAAVRAASGREPSAVIGKPNIPMVEYVVDKFGIKGESVGRCLMVGDKLDTDIVFANKLGCKSLLVFSGVTPRGFAEGEDTSCGISSYNTNPTYTADSVKDLLNLMK